jgi:hypothetical protein
MDELQAVGICDELSRDKERVSFGMILTHAE